MNWIEQKILGFFVKTHGVFSKPLFAGKGLVFMLHRILPTNERNEFTLNRDLAITPEKLEEYILFFKQKGFQFITLDQLVYFLENPKKSKQKFICLTFDDGYIDNLKYGLPIFKKHNVPAAIYVTNCFPNGNGLLWWYLFENHVKVSSNLVIHSSLGRREFTWKNVKDAFDLFGQVSEAIKIVPESELSSVMSQSFGLSTSEFQKQCNAIALTWDEIRQLSNEPLITIGAHTMNHLSMKQQDETVVIEELEKSKKELEAHLGKEVVHFAYPYGGEFDVSARDIQLTEKVGFKTAVLNQPGNIFSSTKNQLFAIPRMTLGDSTSPERIAYYLNGIYHFSANGFHKTKY